MKAEQADEDRRDREIEHVVERRRESLAEERRGDELHRVRGESDDPRRPNGRN